MSKYCLGDLHGNYDLFLNVLDRIDFNYNDKIYILGDVIDRKYGGIKIIQYIMKNQEVFKLILGNHEDFFLNLKEGYDAIMFDNILKIMVQDALNIFSGNLFEKIHNKISELLMSQNTDTIRNNKEVIEWQKISKKRDLILNAMLKIYEYLNYNSQKIETVHRILMTTDSIFKTKPLIKELLELRQDEYIELVRYLASRKSEIRFQYKGRRFWLRHSNFFKNGTNWFVTRNIPSIRSRNNYVIFGHDPIALVHRKLNRPDEPRTFCFDFNYREIFSYIDSNGNHYYNLDMTPDALAALRLDDFEEYYVANKSLIPNIIQYQPNPH